MGSWCFRFACLLFTVGVYVRETQSEVSAEDQECIKTFMEGREDFVLDTEESINDGAVFLANPGVEDSLACTVACCGHPRCNLAFVEQGNEKGCFLFNCLYKDKYVCRFFHKEGFKIYVLDSLHENYLNIRKSDKDKAPIANAGRDVVVQPDEEVFLNGIESWDDGKIVKYEWSLIRGDESVQMEKTDFSDQLRVSNLKPGLYEFKLTVTDSAHLSDSDQVSVLVLTPEQSERNCLTPKKAGPCKGAFPRWHYNAASSKCENFDFGGCKDNNNNYLSEQECLNACKNITVIPGGDSRKVTVEECSTSCGEDQFKCSNGCCVNKEFECDGHQHCGDGSDETNCEQLTKSLGRLLEIGVNEKAHCTDPPDTGPCRASFTRWYYDPLNKRCHRFVFGGCDGNDNNFETTDKCMSNCSGVTEKDVFARGLFARLDDGLGESQSASVALAVVLVVGILAVLAVLGYFFLKNRRKNHQHQRVATNSPPVALGEEHQQMVYNSTTAKA